MPNNINPLVSCGRDCRIDEGAYVGMEPLRSISGRPSVIGDNAVCLRGSIIYLGSAIGRNLVIAHNAIIREESTIGDNFNLWSNSVIDYGCTIGNNVKIHCNVYVAQFTVIEDDCFLAPGVVIANDKHPGCRDSRKCLKGPTIKRGAQIGCNVTINPGVVIGAGAMIGSGSVVVEDVPAGKVVCGNPAKVIKQVSKIKCDRFEGEYYRNTVTGI